ncbi:hypothetical protein Tco_0654522 [Tanacetum coccineum]|uniref:Uncharacterized protein n=1 Tax=Tanacetum coccineum TaxID=301880 RepID=A0ABQ4X3Y4_9ASTR
MWSYSWKNQKKVMFAAIETRFGGNAATKKTQENSLEATPEIEDLSIDDCIQFKIVETKDRREQLTSHRAKYEDDLGCNGLRALSLLSVEQRSISEGQARYKDDQFTNQGTTLRKQGNKEDTSKAMLAIDGVGFDWYDMAEEQVQSNMALMAFSDSEVKIRFVEDCGSNNSKRVSEVKPKKVRDNNDAPIIEDWVSYDEEQDESMTKPIKKIVIPTAAKIKKLVRKSVRYAEMYRSQRPRGNQRNWNEIVLTIKEKGGKLGTIRTEVEISIMPRPNP